MKIMTENNKKKVIECLFDPEISEILESLEDGGKESSYLEKKTGLSDAEITNKLGYLLEHKFVFKKQENGKKIYSADVNELGRIMESDENFKGLVDGLTEMDSYLN